MDTNFLQKFHQQVNPIPQVPVLSNFQQPQQHNDHQPHHAQSLLADADKFKERRFQEEQSTLLRLQYDFEFVQHLVSPDYVRYLFKKGYFDKPEFMNYLRYLTYFRRPDYQRLLLQPKCLDVLDMLLKEEVRTEIERNPDFTNYFSC